MPQAFFKAITLAPIVLFVYHRPEHTKQVLNALALNPLADQSILYIYADGPKKDSSADALANIAKTRSVIRQEQWCKEVFIIEADTNLGLANSVIKGVTEVVNKHGKVIVLEDDLLTSKHFLQYMNDALNVYETEQQVLSIGALNFFATDKQVPDTFFIPIPDCWGWATWKDRWQLFEPNPQLLLNKLREKGLIEKFNLYGAYNFESMLIDQIKGNVSSWAIRWQAVAYLENKLSLYPRNSVTKNIGFGADATHGGTDNYSKKIKFAVKKIKIEKQSVTENPTIINKMIVGYAMVNQPSGIARTKLAIRSVSKGLAPAFLSKLYRKLHPHPQNKSMWQGNYTSWDEARKLCSGYEDPVILNKTKEAILKVKNGEAAAERDSVLFEHPLYNEAITSHLLKFAHENNDRLNVVDFGGSLGSTYFQNKDLIPDNINFSWNVVEQQHYVETGNKEIADDKLHFFYSINEAVNRNTANVLILSSVLQYLEKPYAFLDEIIAYNFKYIIIDRTSFTNEPTDRLTIQNVPVDIYEASYPAWFFNNEYFKTNLTRHYTILHEFKSDVIDNLVLDDGTNVYWLGYILERKQHD
ncbi:MAG: methyltransferase, TIGR04325 family [Bacteroidota bacterium]